MTMRFLLLVLLSTGLTGCAVPEEPATSPSPVPSKKTVAIKPVPSPAKAVTKPTVKRAKPVVDLSTLWGASRKQVTRQLQKYKITEREDIPKFEGDPLLEGLTYIDYDLGHDTTLSVWFNSQNTATLVSVANQMNDNGLNIKLADWPKLFAKYGLPDAGTPVVMAPNGYRWVPPKNPTGGFVIHIVSFENLYIWQVQISKPDPSEKE